MMPIAEPALLLIAVLVAGAALIAVIMRLRGARTLRSTVGPSTAPRKPGDAIKSMDRLGEQSEVHVARLNDRTDEAHRAHGARRSDGRASERPIPSEMLRRIRQIEIRARRLVSNIFLGEYHSVFRGKGIEFAEVRQYEPGDDVRLIDWNVTARMGSPYVKKYIEERELTVMLLVDVSASSTFTTADLSKRELAAEVAATLAFAAIANGDRVGLIAFSSDVERYIEPGKDRRHVLRIIRELLYLEPEHRGTGIGRAALFLARVARRRAIVFLMSDFFDSGYEQPLRALALRHEVIALTLNDPRDGRLPDVGLLEVEDPETGRRALLDTSSRSVREEYALRARALNDERRRTLAAIGVEEVALSTDRSYVEPLLRLFRDRERPSRSQPGRTHVHRL